MILFVTVGLKVFGGFIVATSRQEQQAEVRLKMMRLIAQNLEMPSRQLATEVCIANGSVYCILTVLIKKDLLSQEILKAVLGKNMSIY